MGDGILGTDLFGDPVEMRPERRGRPEHFRTLETVNKVLVTLAISGKPKDAASAIGVSVPTLRKHYFSELAKADKARAMLVADMRMKLAAAAQAGNVAAIKEMFKQVEKASVAEIAESFGVERSGKRKKAEPKRPLGKKEEAQLAASTAGLDSDWGDDLIGGCVLVN